MALRLLSTIVFPWRSNAGPALLVWPLHVLVWGSLFLVLWQLNSWTDMERWLRSPWPVLHRAWLPLVALLIYALAGLCGRLWNSLADDAEASVRADVVAVWEEASSLLNQNYYRSEEMPLFLVLGSFTSEVRSLFESAGASAILSRPAAPLRVFAQQQAIFVVCETEKGPDTFFEVCSLLRHHRQERGAAQGVVLLVPIQALLNDQEMLRVVAQYQDDLRILRSTTDLECPLHVAVVRPESAQHSAVKEGWFVRFPPMSDCTPDEMAELLAERVYRLCLQTIPRLVRQQMKLDIASTRLGTLPEPLRENIRQYEFLVLLQSWRARLCRLLTEATKNDAAGPGLLAGCYFLPSSKEVMPTSAVVEALWSDLLTHQQAATWTPDMWARREIERSRIRTGYGMVVVGWLGLLALAGWFFSGLR